MLLFSVDIIKAQTISKPLEEFLGMFVLPIEIGNVWNYRDGYLQPERKISLIDTLNIDNKKYYLMKFIASSGYTEAFQYVRLREDGFYVSRVLDSMLTSFPNEDYLYYKKDAKKGDVWNQREVRGFLWYHIVLDTIEVASFWGTFIPVKIVEVTDSSLTRYWEYWSDEFGLVQQQNSDIGSGGWTLLWGCYVNGTKYGDTVLVSVDEKYNMVPNEFKLYQNHPNPFNSTTVIPYEVSITSFVSIKIFDLLGREIVELVNEFKPPGKYAAEFNSYRIKGEIPSNVYFYQLKVDQKKETKKMILLK
jgi:hypothetical protein